MKKLKTRIERQSRRSAAFLARKVKGLPWYVTGASLLVNLAGGLALWRAYRRPRSIGSDVADRVGEALLGALGGRGEKATEIRSRMTGRDYGLMAACAGLGLCLTAIPRLFRRS